MKFMLMHSSNADLEAGRPPDPEVLGRVDEVLQEMRTAGVLLMVEGLSPSSTGARITFPGGEPLVTDGPFVEAKELIAGISMIDVGSKDEAVGWALRFAEIDPGTEIQILRVTD